MNLEITALMLAFSVVSMIFGLLAKNILFAVGGGILSIFLGISLAGEGLVVQRVVNDTLVNTTSSGVWVGGFGAILILIGLGIILLISLEMFGGER